MTGVSYLDSSGIAALVEGLKRSNNTSHRFLLAGVQPAPMQVLKLTRLDQVFSLHPNVSRAVKYLGVD